MLSPYPETIAGAIEATGDRILARTEPCDVTTIADTGAEFIVSYGYKHIIGPQVLAQLERKFINLHISLLPWNRGYHPNIWSFVDDTPKGVTIHYIDEGIDTGDVIVQREIVFQSDETVSSSYRKLRALIENLFRESWPAIRAGDAAPRKQEPGGSVHRESDLASIAHVLSKGWDTPTAELVAFGSKRRQMPRNTTGHGR